MIILSLAVSMHTTAQTYTHYTTTEQEAWKQGKTTLSTKPAADAVLTITGQEHGHEFKS